MNPDGTIGTPRMAPIIRHLQDVGIHFEDRQTTNKPKTMNKREWKSFRYTWERYLITYGNIPEKVAT